MIKEFALNPDALCAWPMFKHIAQGLGFFHGRVFARYPKDWRRRAYERAASMDQSNQKKLEVWLADVAPQAMVDSRKGFPFDGQKPWFANAISSHAQTPFHAIISDHPDSETPPILDVTDVDGTKPLWNVKKQEFISRQASALAPLVISLLAHAKEIRIIDPYFVADPDQVKVLTECLTAANGACVAPAVRSIELHVSGKNIQGGTIAHVQRQIALRWPVGMPVAGLVRWREDYLHNRLILCDLGGFILGDTLREHHARPDQLTLLEPEPWKKWWDYHDRSQHATDLAK